jgi:hypothetical protein
MNPINLVYEDDANSDLDLTEAAKDYFVKLGLKLP